MSEKDGWDSLQDKLRSAQEALDAIQESGAKNSELLMLAKIRLEEAHMRVDERFRTELGDGNLRGFIDAGKKVRRQKTAGRPEVVPRLSDQREQPIHGVFFGDETPTSKYPLTGPRIEVAFDFDRVYLAKYGFSNVKGLLQRYYGDVLEYVITGSAHGRVSYLDIFHQFKSYSAIARVRGVTLDGETRDVLVVPAGAVRPISVDMRDIGLANRE